MKKCEASPESSESMQIIILKQIQRIINKHLTYFQSNESSSFYCTTIKQIIINEKETIFATNHFMGVRWASIKNLPGADAT